MSARKSRPGTTAYQGPPVAVRFPHQMEMLMRSLCADDGILLAQFIRGAVEAELRRRVPGLGSLRSENPMLAEYDASERGADGGASRKVGGVG